jgi:hypothetical protein
MVLLPAHPAIFVDIYLVLAFLRIQAGLDGNKKQGQEGSRKKMLHSMSVNGFIYWLRLVFCQSFNRGFVKFIKVY